MQKIEITVVVPERILELTQNYLQRIVLGDNMSQFHKFLETWGVFEPEQYTSEMEIGIKHPDDEPVKIASYDDKEHQGTRIWIEDNYFPSYKDKVLDEDLYSTDLDDDSLSPPQHVLDFIQSVKATDCSYFRFVK